MMLLAGDVTQIGRLRNLLVRVHSTESRILITRWGEIKGQVAASYGSFILG